MTEENYYKHTFLSNKDKLFRYAFFLMKDQELARDVLQDAFIKIWNKRATWTEIENAGAWSMQIVKNMCLDKLRREQTVRKHHEKMVISDRDVKDPGKISDWKDQLNVLHEVIDQLSEKQKMVFTLREIEGDSYQEIAEKLSITESQVKTDLFRSRKFLKETMLKINNHGVSKIKSIA